MQTKEHDAQKSRLEKERGQDLKSDHRADSKASELRKACEPKPELEGEHDACNHTDAEGHREDAQPEAVDLEVNIILRLHRPSMTARNDASPMEIVGKMMWKLTVKCELNAGDKRGVHPYDSIVSAGLRWKDKSAAAANTTRPNIASINPKTPMIAKNENAPATAKHTIVAIREAG